MTEPPHPHMPGGSNAFHPHGGHPWGTASSPWMHYHHAYNTHWRGYGCGRARGRLLFFMLGAGAATLFFKWKCHGEEWSGYGSGGNGSRFRRQERVEYPDGAADSARVATSNRAEEENQRPRWAHRTWAWRGENRRAAPHDPVQAPADSPAVPASNSKFPAPPVTGDNTHAEPGSTYTWKWDQDAMVKNATGTVVDLTESGLDSLVATINGLKLRLKAAEASVAAAEKERKQPHEEPSDRKLV